MKTLQEAQKRLAILAESDTGLGGWLKMNPAYQRQLAYEMLAFADPQAYMVALQTLSVAKPNQEDRKQ